MRWITDKHEFDNLTKYARTCVYTDSGRNETDLQRLQFDDAFFRTPRFGNLIKTLMEWSNLDKIYFLVLDPDPYTYFWDKYGMYPCFELEQRDFPEIYLEALNKSFSGQPLDNLGTLRWEFVFASPSMPWFVHTLQSNENNGGHLWVPQDWPARIFEFDRNFLEARDLLN